MIALSALLLAVALWVAVSESQTRRLRRVLRGVPADRPAPCRWALLAPPRPSVGAFGIDLLAALSGELAAGQPPAQAFRNAVAELGEPAARLPRTVAALRLDGDLARALTDDARAGPTELQPLLLGLAALWRVSETAGGGLAIGIAALAASERHRLDALRELRAELAGPRATAFVLALLPVAGLLLGSALGADPLAWLLGSPLGWVDLGVAVVLVGAGTRWVLAIAAGAERAR